MSKKEKCHPKETANFISQVTLWWIIGLLWKGSSRPLEQDDLYSVMDDDRAEHLTKLLQKKWDEEIGLAKKSKRNPPLWKALLTFFTWKQYGIIACTMLSSILAENILWFTTIRLLDLLWNRLSLVTSSTIISQQQLLPYVCGMVMANLVKGLSNNHFFLQGAFLGVRARAAVLGLLYKKVRKMSVEFIQNFLVLKRNS